MKIKVTQEVQIPTDMVVYDFGTETLNCGGCGVREPCQVVPPPGGALRNGAPAVEIVFEKFATKHAACVAALLSMKPRPIPFPSAYSRDPHADGPHLSADSRDSHADHAALEARTIHPKPQGPLA